MKITSAEFIKSAPDASHYPPETLPEIAFPRSLERRQVEPHQFPLKPQRSGAHIQHAGSHAATEFLPHQQSFQFR
jgi:hypothetical protein